MTAKQDKSIELHVTTINYLNDDCLIHIFSFLPIMDRVKIKTVCRRWRSISHLSWQSLKRLSISQNFWGIGDRCKVEINRDILKKVLQLCGQYVTYIDLSISTIRNNCPIRIQSCKNVFKIIHMMCPNIRSINAGRPCTVSTVDFIANNFMNLTHFSITGVSENFEDVLTALLSNNQTIKYLSLEQCDLSNKFLLHLNHEIFEEIYLVECSLDILQHTLNALKKLKKLSSIKFKGCRSIHITWMSSILDAITNSKKLKKLDIYFYNCGIEPIEYRCMARLNNLERLCIGGNIMVTDDILQVIGINCRKLKDVKIYHSERVTDDGILYITGLPNIQCLSLSGLEMVTDNCFEITTNLVSLEFRRCRNIKNSGISRLLLYSDRIQNIKINCCKKISALDLIMNVIECKSSKLTVEIDSSEIEDDFVQYYHQIVKFGDHIIKKIKKLCFECFQAVNVDENCSHCCYTEEVL